MTNSKDTLKKVTKEAAKMFTDPEEKNETDWLESAEEDLEGQLAVDVYETADDVVIKAPIAGVKPADLDIAVTDETVTVKGERMDMVNEEGRNYHAQECYWGVFSRTYSLPVSVDAEKANAVLKDGILTVTLPKIERLKKRQLKVESA